MHLRQIILLFVFVLVIFLAACAPPHGLPAGPTPIPTLIPVTQLPSLPGTTAEPAFAILSFPGGFPSAEFGQPLYQTHCAECHGEDGNGVIPEARNFGDVDYMRGETPALLYAAITEGRGEMPGFKDTLTSDERWDVVYYVWGFSTTSENIAMGQTIYATNCSACHGDDGIGEVLGSSDFTDLRLISAQAPRDFYLVVTQGKGSMPAWQGRLSQEERWAVIDYMITFSYDPALWAEIQAEPTSEEVGEPDDETISEPANADLGDPVQGGTLFSQFCTGCHGLNGETSVGDDLVLRDAIATLDDSDVARVIRDGANGMPSFQALLTTEGINDLLAYLRKWE